MLESIYYVITWACRRECAHCYDDRFRPYTPVEVDDLIAREKAILPRIVANLPEELQYIDLEDQDANGTFPSKSGRIILSGGEVLMDPVRERLLYPLLAMLRGRYARDVRLVIQTSGDLLTPEIINQLLEQGIWMISVSSIDSFHGGELSREQVRDNLTRMFTAAGMQPSALAAGERRWRDEEGPVFSFFGATRDSWIGKLWPSGRAWKNGLSTARYVDNFCNNWSGGLNFLNLGYSGSEVAIDPEGNVYPCCRKTRLPYGNLAAEPLRTILERLQGQPQFEAITNGHPERMGLIHGISPGDFINLSRTIDPRGRAYVNRCIGCDRLHEKYLGPVLEKLRQHDRP
ncbi:hypothetical protein [Desulfobulbus alkaliphilus]|uniref:hypothetical protein n=1 Tax=Desulfobulbus alkaliphilus TaxID=869814 RepID=UPI0019623FE8|nr:hypothetical protein [Desulfobulbus alkaliphilus]MBM9537876.1 hypothetical protein [Desulfobulbus alkaliphilus]